MMAWMNANDAIGLYWAEQQRHPDRDPQTARSLADQGEAGQENTPEVTSTGWGLCWVAACSIRALYLPDNEPLSEASVGSARARSLAERGLPADPERAPLCRIPRRSDRIPGRPRPANLPYQLADYPDALAAFRLGLYSGQGQ